MSSAKVSSIRPSEGRRAALRQAEGEMGAEVSNFFPIERYYSAADKVLQSFEKAYNEKRLDDAYVLGLRFATFSLEGLTKHNYYHSSRYSNLRKKNEMSVKQVIAKLEQVTTWMDDEEAERQRLREEYRKKVEAQRKLLEAERVRRQEAIEKARYKELQDRVEQQRKKSQRGSATNVEQSALSKLQMLNAPSGQPSPRMNGNMGDMSINDGRRHKSTGSLMTNGSERPEMTKQASAVSRRSRWQQEETGSSIDAPGSLLGGEDVLPPPIPPPPPPTMGDDTPPPPSYNQAMSAHDKLVQQQQTNRRPSTNDVAVQRPVTASAGCALILPESSDLISFPEPPGEIAEVLPPPPPYCTFDVAFLIVCAFYTCVP